MGPPGGPGTYVNTYALLRLLDATIWPNGYQAFVAGHTTIHDGGQGVFTYLAAATDADNDGTIIAPANGIGRWFRDFTGPISVRWFGATGDNVTDDTDALQAALDTVAIGDGTTVPRGLAVYIPTGVYKFSSLTIARGTILDGDGPDLTILRRTDTTGYAIAFDSTGLTPGGSGDRIEIKNLSLFQVGVATNGGGISLNGVTDTVQGIFENVRVEGCYRGILTTNSLGTYLRNVQVFSSVSDGFYFIGGATRTVAIDCYAQDCGASGFSISGGSSCSFMGCGANDNVMNGFYAINTQYCSWYGCSNQGNAIGLYMTNCVGNVIDTFFTYAKVNADNAILLDDSNSNEIRNIASNHQNAAYGTYMVEIQNGSEDNTLSVGFLSNNWPSGLTNTPAGFNVIRNAGVVTMNTDMIFTSQSISVNLPTSPGATDELWANSGVVEVSP